MRPAIEVGRFRLLAVYVAAIVGLGLLQVWRFPQLLDPSPLADEGIYLDAFERAAAGQSPYQGAYFYLPVFAHAGGFVLGLVGEVGVLVLMRATNVLAVASIVWCSLRLLGTSHIRRLAIAAVFVLVAPVVYYIYLWGNLSAPVVGVSLLGLWIARRRTFVAGVLLALAVLVKPVAMAALAILATYRDGEHDAGAAAQTLPLGLNRGQWALLLVVAPLTAGAVLLPPHLDGFLAVEQEQFDTLSNASLYQLLRSFGIEVPALALAASFLVVGVVAGRLRRWRWVELYGLCASVSLFSLPAVWTHTLLLTLPMQVLALRAGWRRWRERASAASPPQRTLEWVLVVGSVLAVELSQSLSAYGSLPSSVQGLVLLWPVLAPTGLAVYVARWCAPAALAKEGTGESLDVAV